jgi:hypothetical protein
VGVIPSGAVLGRPPAFSRGRAKRGEGRDLAWTGPASARAKSLGPLVKTRAFGMTPRGSEFKPHRTTLAPTHLIASSSLS